MGASLAKEKEEVIVRASRAISFGHRAEGCCPRPDHRHHRPVIRTHLPSRRLTISHEEAWVVVIAQHVPSLHTSCFQLSGCSFGGQVRA